MSIYRRQATGKYWQYDFQQKGRRFYGSTGQIARRKALEVEEDLKHKAKLGLLGQVEDLTLDEAALRWWNERGHRLAKPHILEKEIERLVKLIGPNVLLSEVTTNRVAAAVQKRRAMKTRRGKLSANVTINRDTLANLRRILRYAAEIWEIPNLRPIAWRKVRLDEPKPKIRGDFTPEELARAVEHLPEHWRDFFAFMRRYGPRLGEMFFRLEALDVGRARLTLRERKGDDDHAIPLLEADVAMLAARLGRARAAGLNTVWFRELKGGRLKALTYYAASSAIHKALTDAGLKASKGARLHDLRHHAGTEILRASKNLKVAQQLLGHATIATTMRYAHALDEDVRAGLEAVAGVKPPPAAPEPETPAEAAQDERKTA